MRTSTSRSVGAKIGLILSIALNVYFLVSPQFLEYYSRVPLEEQNAKRSIKPTVTQTTPNSSKLEGTTSILVSHENTTLPSTQSELADLHAHHVLVVIVVSSPGNLDRRNVIRKTWKNGYKQRSHYVKFVLATRNLNTELADSIAKENLTYNDLLLISNVEDAYNQHSHLILATMRLFDKNVNYSYLLKTDDTTFVTLDRIEDELKIRNHTQGLYWGYFIGDAFPHDTGIYAEPNWRFCDTYFPYAFAAGYVLSADVVHEITLTADDLIVYNNEDVSVSAWTIMYDIERKHDVRFDTSESRGCKNSFLVTVQESPEAITSKHELYSKTGKLCEEETVTGEYEYDWSKLPAEAHKPL